MADLSGASILVLGATGGLGRHIVGQLSAAGAKLTMSARSQQALDDLEVAGVRIAGDLRDPDLADALVAAAVMAHGRLDGVINASGVVAFGPIAETSDAVIDELWQVNALAPMRIIRAAVPALAEAKADGGEPFIVHISGIVSEHPSAGLGVYSAVKAAVAALQQVAARELRRQGIRVLDARPGHTETDLSRHPLAGEAPKLPTGYDPVGVARRIVAAIIGDEKDLPSSAFTEVAAAQSEMVPVEPADINTGAHPAVRMAAEMPLERSAPVGSGAEPGDAARTDRRTGL
jgi:NAD(P)-dependent dehydrogenase (short-subunit alcohol dehydrogenase family)